MTFCAALWRCVLPNFLRRDIEQPNEAGQMRRSLWIAALMLIVGLLQAWRMNSIVRYEQRGAHLWYLALLITGAVAAWLALLRLSSEEAALHHYASLEFDDNEDAASIPLEELMVQRERVTEVIEAQRARAIEVQRQRELEEVDRRFEERKKILQGGTAEAEDQAADCI